MANSDDPRKIVARPTKQFFIDMLVKDIQLIPAIVDLIDNSVDGARRLRPDEDYDGLWVRVTAEPDGFSITDNCGGIPVNLAREYAFRFGRPADFPKTEHSVGQFGVGMKRALFKLGREFRIGSTAPGSRFSMTVNVDEWEAASEDWTFEFDEVEEDASYPMDECGTSIEVTRLHESVAEDFGLDSFQGKLRDEIGSAHQVNMQNGLSVSLNGLPLDADFATLLRSSALEPAFKKLEYDGEGPPVTVRLFAGLSESDPSKAGWYIFCNGRMVVEADQTMLTGWGEGGGKTIPKYHNQFARFRGYALFDSDDAGKLPWNTTKTGVDQDDPVFRSVRPKMITLMRPVIDTLNELDREREQREEEGPGPLETTVDRAKPQTLADLPEADIFVIEKPPPPKDKGPKVGRIRYEKPVEQIKAIQDILDVSTYKEVGERTFEYFLRMEVDVE